MKKVFIVLMGILIAQISFSQLVNLGNLSKSYEPIYVEKHSELKSLKIPTQYSESIFLLSEEYYILNDVEVLAIDLVYTEYPKNISFEALNARRLIWLYKQFPRFKNNNILSGLIGQTSATKKKEAEKLFHGFVIYYREKPTKATMEAEINFIKKMTDSIKPVSATKKGESSLTDLVSDIDSKITSLDHRMLKGYTYTCYTEALKKYQDSIYGNSTRMSKKEMLDHGYMSKEIYEQDYKKICDSFVISFHHYDTVGYETNYININTDSTVFKAFTRNKWSNMLICADVTGSMSPYTTQLLLWIKLNTGKLSVKSYLFFNDGNNTPDHKKIIGNTGGIYEIRSSKYDDVSSTIYKAMAAGSGGDAPENNIEALLKGVEMNIDATDIILIADNWAPVKDMSLLNKITKPVKVILCGSNGYINPDYLTIAYKTGGSVHTMEEDITELMKLKEGDTFTFKGVKYRIVDGKFVSEAYKYVGGI
jgi:hypothetical protein